jgi:hypothetical protein
MKLNYINITQQIWRAISYILPKVVLIMTKTKQKKMYVARYKDNRGFGGWYQSSEHMNPHSAFFAQDDKEALQIAKQQGRGTSLELEFLVELNLRARTVHKASGFKPYPDKCEGETMDLHYIIQRAVK